MILYHVTRKKFLSRILKYGIKPGTSPVHGEIKRYIYLTDKKGIDTVVAYWIYCDEDPVILKVNIPVDWLVDTKGRVERYANPYIARHAREWLSFEKIPPENIMKIYEYRCE